MYKRQPSANGAVRGNSRSHNVDPGPIATASPNHRCSALITVSAASSGNPPGDRRASADPPAGVLPAPLLELLPRSAESGLCGSMESPGIPEVAAENRPPAEQNRRPHLEEAIEIIPGVTGRSKPFRVRRQIANHPRLCHSPMVNRDTLSPIVSTHASKRAYKSSANRARSDN